MQMFKSRLNYNVNDHVILLLIHSIYVTDNNKFVFSQRLKQTFLRKKCLASVRNKNTYLGYCIDCPEMCGINL